MKKNILLLLLSCSLALSVSAKPGKIKFGKCIRFEGEVVDKLPQGPGQLIVFDDANDEKEILRVSGNFFMSYGYIGQKEFRKIPLRVEEGIINYCATQWTLKGEALILLEDYEKLKEINLSVTVDQPKAYSALHAQPLSVKENFKFSASTQKSNIQYSFVPNITENLNLSINPVSLSLQQNLKGGTSYTKEVSGEYNGSGLLMPDGSLNLLNGNFVAGDTEYSVAFSGNSYIVSRIKTPKALFEEKNGLLNLKEFSVDNGFTVFGKKSDGGDDCFVGMVKDSKSKFEGSFVLTHSAATPQEYLDGITMDAVRYKTGLLAENYVKYNGTWNEDNSFSGSYKSAGYDLHKCTITPEGVISGEGTKTVGDSLTYEGYFKDLKMDGQVECTYKEYSPLQCVCANDTIISAVTTVEDGDDSYEFSVALQEGMYVYSLDGKEMGKGELFDIIKEMNRYPVKLAIARNEAFLNKLYPIGKDGGLFFHGKSNQVNDASKLLFSLYGINNAYVDGEVLLALLSDGTSLYFCKCSPSRRAMQSGSASLNQRVGMICAQSTDGGYGKWYVEDGKIIATTVDEGKVSKHTFTLSPDKKKLLHEGLYSTTLVRVPADKIESVMGSAFKMFPDF